MSSAVDMLKLTEAAVVAHVALREVNRVVDERILPDCFISTDDGRRVATAACPLISFYFDSARRLTAEERVFALNEAGSRLQKFRALDFDSLIAEDWTVRDDFLTIDFAPFLRGANERMRRLEAARAVVVSDPEILGGTPVLRGTRVPVYDVAACVTAGDSMQDILEAYPSINADKIGLAAIFAEANPVRGRPRAFKELPEGAILIEEGWIPRRRKAG